MFSRGILETRPEVFHPDYFVVRMCCQGLKPGKLVNIRFVWNITRSQISSALLLSGARFEGLEAGRKKKPIMASFILGNFSFCGSLMQIYQIWKMGEKTPNICGKLLSIRWSFFSNFASRWEEMVINSVLEKHVRKTRRRTCEKAAKFKFDFATVLQPFLPQE